MTKEEKIKEAYREDYKFINEFLIGNGFFDGECDDLIHLRRKLYKNGGVDIKIIDEVQFVRPKSLEGIENNNGWIKVESEADLPKSHLDVYMFDEINNISFGFWDNLQMCFKDRFGQEYQFITHYQPIEKPKPPIY